VHGFVIWLLERRYRLLLVAVALCPILPVVSIALLSLETQARGLQQGLLSAGISILGVVLVAVAANASVASMAGVGAFAFLLGVALGGLMGWSRSLTLAFQAAVLSCTLAVLVVLFAINDPTAFWTPAMNAIADALTASGASEEQLALLQSLRPVLFGLLAAAAFGLMVGAACLGRWWYTMTDEQLDFAGEFRALKMGRILSVPATVLVLIGLVTNLLVLENVLPVMLLAFLMQGLAVAHAWSHGRDWHPAVLTGIYILWLLPTPLAAAVSVLLSSVGLVDSWVDLRAPAARPA
jgi:hypothetical protein